MGINRTFAEGFQANPREYAAPVVLASGEAEPLIINVKAGLALFGKHALLPPRSQEAGGDRETPYGRIGGSEHERRVFGLGGGWQSGGHELALDIRRSETGPSGNPPFPMDIRYFDTDMAQLRYRGAFDTVRLELRAGWSDVDHAMNNYDLRPAPAMMRWRETYAQAQTRTLSAALATEGSNRTNAWRGGGKRWSGRGITKTPVNWPGC